jgi:GTP cyclohydrolase II
MNKNQGDIKSENRPKQDTRFVDRASDDIRRGLIVCQKSNDVIIYGAATELLTPDSVATIRALPNSKYGILLSDHRCEALKIHTKGQKALFIVLDETWDAKSINALADPTLDLKNPLRGPFKAELLTNISKDLNGFLKLMKLSRLLPGAFIAITSNKVGNWASKNNILTVELSAVYNYEDVKASSLTIVAEAKVPLKGAENSKVVSFRPSNGGPEHLAIIIGGGNKKTAPLIRLHSECFTGDLLGSLKCDCGDQLKGAIEKISKEGGGNCSVFSPGREGSWPYIKTKSLFLARPRI